MKKILTLGAAACVVALAGCGQSGQTTPTSSTAAEQPSASAPASVAPSAPATQSPSKVVDNACLVFTSAELGGVLNVTMGEGDNSGYKVMTNGDGLPLVQCEWEQGGGGPAEYTVNLGVENFASTDRAKASIDASNVNVGNLTSQVVPGVADGALIARSGDPKKPVQAAIYWRKGTAVYHLSAVRMDGVDRVLIESMMLELVSRKFGGS